MLQVEASFFSHHRVPPILIGDTYTLAAACGTSMCGSKKPAVPYSRAGRTTIGPGCLSAVFGMGTGVPTRVWPPAGSVCRQVGGSESRLESSDVATRPVVPCVGGGGGVAKRSAVSTGQLSVLLHLYLRPIDPVVSREPSCVDA